MTKSVLGYLECSSVKEISSLLLNLTSGKFLGHGQKAVTSSSTTIPPNSTGMIVYTVPF